MGIYRLSDVNKKILWGGTKLSECFGKGTRGESIAESWVLCVHEEGENKLEDGRLLSDIAGKPFPFMIKLIDSADALSIQVHPAKTEMWYIIDCEEGASLVLGLKEKFDRKQFLEAVSAGRTEEMLRYVPVHPGDIYFIPQGLVHAIGKGITIAEIQQNSNVTYRIYDYNRLKDGRPRELHIAEALDVIRDFSQEDIDKLRFECGKGGPEMIASCPYFRTFLYETDNRMTLPAGNSFSSLLCISGEGTVNGTSLKAGDSFFIEKETAVTISGHVKVLITEHPVSPEH